MRIRSKGAGYLKDTAALPLVTPQMTFHLIEAASIEEGEGKINANRHSTSLQRKSFPALIQAARPDAPRIIGLAVPPALPDISIEICPRCFEALRVVGGLQVINAHTAVGRWRMNEAIIPDINADVGERCVARVEKNQVTRTQAAAFDTPSLASDVRSAAADLHANRFVIDVGHHTAAIKTGFRILSAKTVAGIDQTKSKKHNFVALFAVFGVQGLRFRRSFDDWRHATRRQNKNKPAGCQGSIPHGIKYIRRAISRDKKRSGHTDPVAPLLLRGVERLVGKRQSLAARRLTVGHYRGDPDADRNAISNG